MVPTSEHWGRLSFLAAVHSRLGPLTLESVARSYKLFVGHQKGHSDPREPVSHGGLSCFLDPLEYTRCEVIL